jgi:hypothetical protein
MASHSKQVKDSELLVKDYLRVEGMIGVLKTMRADVNRSMTLQYQPLAATGLSVLLVAL